MEERGSWRQDAQYFLQHKLFGISLGLSALLSYGFLLTHETVGIDDTAYALYFEDGLAAIAGRWLLFLLNKILHISDFGPFVLDFCGVVFLTGAAVVLSILLRRILRDRVPLMGYVFFACFLVANPIWAEVFTYYLHNGLGLGYFLTGASLFLFMEGIWQRKKRLLACSALLLWGAIGCYESLMVVWLVGLFLLLLAGQLAGEKQRVVLRLLTGACVMLAAMVLRSLWIPVLDLIFHLDPVKGILRTRSLGEMLVWMTDAEGRASFVMALKRAYVMYGAFACAYYPVFLFVLGAAALVITGLVRSIRKKEAWSILLALGALISCFLLIPIEGTVTLYRSAQFLPLICGFGALCLSLLAAHGRRWVKGRKAGAAVLLGILLFNQCVDMNQWFYLDYLKYEDAKNTMNRIAYDLEKAYDLTKPVIFTGSYQVPRSIAQPAYVPYGSETFYRINRLTQWLDPHLLEKFYREYGVWVAQTPELSVIEWGREAFDNNRELAKFFAMHGHFFRPVEDMELIREAKDRAYELELPAFPREGYIRDMGDYIIVNL